MRVLRLCPLRFTWNADRRPCSIDMPPGLYWRRKRGKGVPTLSIGILGLSLVPPTCRVRDIGRRDSFISYRHYFCPHIHSVFGDPLKTSVAMSPVALPWSSVGLGFWKPIQRGTRFLKCRPNHLTFIVVIAIVTGCAVAQHCYNGDVSFLWENGNFDPL